MSTPQNNPSIRDRVLVLIRAVTTDSRRFKELEERTRVPAATWRSFWNRDGALPSGAMLEEIGREWPQYAFWILTGVDDWENGHVAPSNAPNLTAEQRAESPAANAYFTARVQQENSRPSSLPAELMEALAKHAKREQAADMLGGHMAVSEIREELERRGVTIKKRFERLSDLLEETSDPVLDRAVEVLERELKAKQSAALMELKDARDAERRSRQDAFKEQ